MAKDMLCLRVLEEGHVRLEIVLSEPVELGRQRREDPGPYEVVPLAGEITRRLIIAPSGENNIARRHITLTPLSSDSVQIANGSRIPLPHDQESLEAVAPGGNLALKPPFCLYLASRSIGVYPGDSVDELGMKSLSETSAALRSLSCPSDELRSLSLGRPHILDELATWLQTTIGVVCSALGGEEFLEEACQGLVQIVGLTSGRALLCRDEQWEVVAASQGIKVDAPWKPSQHVLDRVSAEKRTVWQYPRQSRQEITPSLQSLDTVIASPLLSKSGEVIGALYGEQAQKEGVALPTVGKLEALLVDLIACGVSTGLARQEHERRAAEARARFEQFFTPELAQELQRSPDLLEGREAIVTMLFCDVRSFSTLSEKLGPARTVEWIGDVMTELSQCVLDEKGVLVDYMGDELFAMWGAPKEQPDQVDRAVRTALAMAQKVEVLNERWQAILGRPMAIGIGINTGMAQVGNTGSRQKFKYGPLGNSVNIASRAQGLTKYLKCPLLVTEATREKLSGEFRTRKVCTARLRNIQEPVVLYEVAPADGKRQVELFAKTEAALEALEQGEMATAARLAGEVLIEKPGDGPLLLILARASDALVHADEPFDPVWEPPGK